MKPSEGVSERPDYAIDVPYVILTLSASGVVCSLLALGSNSLRWLLTTSINILAAIWLYWLTCGYDCFFSQHRHHQNGHIILQFTAAERHDLIH